MITIKYISFDNMQLPLVIYGAIWYPSENKLQEVIASYKAIDHYIIGAFIDSILVGILGFYKEQDIITIRHISILKKFQRQGLGILLLSEIKREYIGYRILAETDEEAVDFYVKVGFICDSFNGPYGNLRYKCYSPPPS